MSLAFDGPVLLDAPHFTTPDVTALTGVPRKHIENWSVPRGKAAQPVLRLGLREPGRHVRYSLLDAIRFAVMHDLTARVPLSPSDAAGAAELLARYVADHSPLDDAGRPIADFNAIGRTLAYAFAFEGEELQVGLIDPARPGYMDFAGSYGRAHIVVPIASLVAGVLERLLHLATAEGVSA